MHTAIPGPGSHPRMFDAVADSLYFSSWPTDIKSFLKSCPEAVSGLGVLRCLKTSEGNSLTKKVFGVCSATNRTYWTYEPNLANLLVLIVSPF